MEMATAETSQEQQRAEAVLDVLSERFPRLASAGAQFIQSIGGHDDAAEMTRAFTEEVKNLNRELGL